MFGPVVTNAVPDQLALTPEGEPRFPGLQWQAHRAAALALDALCTAHAALTGIPDGHPLAEQLERAAGNLDDARRELAAVETSCR